MVISVPQHIGPVKSDKATRKVLRRWCPGRYLPDPGERTLRSGRPVRTLMGDSGKWRRARLAVAVCRKHGINQKPLCVGKEQCAGLGLGELRELRPLREENGKLTRLVADLTIRLEGT
jgi:hypothetical protein